VKNRIFPLAAFSCLSDAILKILRGESMKLGVNTYSFLWNETAENTVEILYKHGFKGIEFTVSPPMFYLGQYRPGMYKEMKKRIDDYGMQVISVLIPSLDVNIASTMPEMRKMTLDLYKRLADLCVELDAETLLTFTGKRHPLLPPKFELIYEYCLEGTRAILDYTRDTNLNIGIETLAGKFIDTVDQLKKLVEDLNNPRVGIVYDAANVFGFEDPAEKLKNVKDYLMLLHLSDTKRSEWKHSTLGTGEVDYKSFVKAVEEIDYAGYLVLEIINDHGIDGILESVRLLESVGINFDR